MTIDFTRLALRLRRERPRAGVLAAEDAGPILGYTESGTPVVWPRACRERAGHVVVMAASGTGKTVSCAQALVEEIGEKTAAEPLSLACVDPKGDLCEAILLGLASSAPERLADVTYLDPFSKGGFPFNLNRLCLGATPLDIRALQLAELVAEVSTATGAQKHLGVGARQLDVLEHAILGALAVPNAHVLLALDALTRPRGLSELASVTTSARARSFLGTAKLSDELRASCASRLRACFAATDSLERLVTAGSCVQFGELLSPGKILLINLGRPFAGLASLQRFWANLATRLAIDHLMERESPWRGHHCRIVIDEAQVVAGVLPAEAILTTGRSRGLSLTTITQGTRLLSQASDTLLSVLMGNCPTKLVGRLSAPDAALFARELSPSRGSDESVRCVQSRFSSSVTNLEDREFFLLQPGRSLRFRTRDVDVAGWQRAAEEGNEALAAVKERLALASETGSRMALSDLAESRRRGGGGRRATSQTLTKPLAGESTGPEAQAPEPQSSRGQPRSRWG